MELNFTNMDTNTIATGVDGDGVPYLKTFLTEYVKHFPGAVNPSCGKCLADYHKKYKQVMAKTETNPQNSGFKLHEKYNGIPLEFGSQIHLTNENLTDEYAKVKLLQEDGTRYFSAYPDGFDPNEFILNPTEQTPVETVNRETLVANLDAAIAAQSALPANAHHMTKKKVEKDIEEAEKALADFDEANPLPEQTPVDTVVNNAEVIE